MNYEMMGQKLRRLREAKGMSTRDAAFFAGISFSYLNQIERGMKNPTIRVIGYLADVYQVPIGEITGAGDNG